MALRPIGDFIPDFLEEVQRKRFEGAKDRVRTISMEEDLEVIRTQVHEIARQRDEAQTQLEQARQDLAYLREENRELRAELEDSMPTDMPI